MMHQPKQKKIKCQDGLGGWMKQVCAFIVFGPWGVPVLENRDGDSEKKVPIASKKRYSLGGDGHKSPRLTPAKKKQKCGFDCVCMYMYICTSHLASGITHSTWGRSQITDTGVDHRRSQITDANHGPQIMDHSP